MNQLRKEYTYPSGQVMQIVQGDITVEMVNAIVNAPNLQLILGSGVAGAILRRAGPQIQSESSQWVREHGPVSHTEPAYTHAGNLPCRYVIHAVGPVWGEGEEDKKLKAAILGSLRLADRLDLGSIAFPAISTGIFGFPKSRAAQLILDTIHSYQAENPTSNLKLIRLVLFDQETLQAFLKVWEQDDHLNP